MWLYWWSLWEYYRNEPNANIIESESCKPETKITGETPNADKKFFQRAGPLEYLRELLNAINWLWN